MMTYDFQQGPTKAHYSIFVVSSDDQKAYEPYAYHTRSLGL